MCGIAFAIRPNTSIEPPLLPLEIWNAVVDAVKPRGPDFSRSLVQHAEVASTAHGYELNFHASVLHMRGTTLTPQPFLSETGNVLLWNGEVFDGLDVPPNSNDGALLFSALQAGPTTPGHLLSVLRPIEGPYAFVYYNATSQQLFFGRDGLGRRSLMVHAPTSDSPFWILASSSPASSATVLREWTEVEVDGVYSLFLSSLDGDANVHQHLKLHPRLPFESASKISPESLARLFSRVNTSVLDEHFPISSPPPSLTASPAQELAIPLLHASLLRSIRQRINPVPLPSSQPSDRQLPSRIAILFSGGIDCTTIALLVSDVLEESESIDLVNVSFENPRSLRGQAQPSKRKTKEAVVVEAPMSEKEMYEVPDRLTGRASCAELRKLRPNRKWNFVECNVPYAEMQEHRQTVIDLMVPNRTVMDLSISLAFYFAARGRGIITDNNGDSAPYESTSRVLLSGLGADELLGGYARHRRAFYTPHDSPGNWSNLIQELQMDIDRINSRNLGRDDRIISFHGKEARYPFLDAKVVDFCATLPIEVKCDFRWGLGVGDKMLLRLLATKLGLTEAASLKKRAIHFGARTAKMELGGGRDKGDALLE